MAVSILQEYGIFEGILVTSCSFEGFQSNMFSLALPLISEEDMRRWAHTFATLVAYLKLGSPGEILKSGQAETTQECKSVVK